MVIKLADVRTRKPCLDTIHATVFDKSAITTYNGNRTMATVSRWHTFLKALMYDIDTLELMSVNGGVQIQDFIPKKDE